MRETNSQGISRWSVIPHLQKRKAVLCVLRICHAQLPKRGMIAVGGHLIFAVTASEDVGFHSDVVFHVSNIILTRLFVKKKGRVK
jgi:hypothetical protein